MSWNNFEKKENVILFTNRFPRSTRNPINGNQKPPDESSSSEKSNSSDSDSDNDSNDTSSSGEFIIMDNYTTLKSHFQNGNPSPNSLKCLSSNQNNHRPAVHHSLFLNTAKSLPVIFERSDESSVCSQSTVESTEDDSTISNCSNSSSSLITNEVSSPISKETENLSESSITETANNSCHITQLHQPISDERNSSIDFSDKLSPSLFQRNDFPMNDSLNCNQTMCNDNRMLDTQSTGVSDDTHRLIGVADLGDTHRLTGVTDLDNTHRLIVPEWTLINKSASLLSQPDLIVNKRTPRFPIKNQYNTIGISNNSESINLDPSGCDSIMDNKHRQNIKPPIAQKPTKHKDHTEPITDLDDLNDYIPDDGSNASELPLDSSIKDKVNEDELQPSGSYFKNQMFKNYSKTDLKMSNNTALRASNNRLYEKRQDPPKVENNKPKTKEQMGLLYQKDSPSKRSQELVGNVVKMDKTINRVTNDIVRIDNAIDKLSQFNKTMMSNLELMSDAELSSDFETHSFGAQTDDYYYQPVGEPNNAPERSVKPPMNNKAAHKKEYWNSGSSSDDSSTEKESSSDSGGSIALKPSPVHQKIDNPQINIKITNPQQKPVVSSKKPIPNKHLENPPYLKHQESDLSSLPESSVCEEPEKRDIVNQVKYFQKQIKKSAGLYKPLPNVEPPKKLVVEDVTLKMKSPQRPIPKPRNSLDGTLTRHMSNSSSESSNYDYNGRTLSNSNNHTQISPSPGNSDSGSIISLNSNHFERRFQKGAGASARYNTKTKPTDKWGTGTRVSQRAKMEEESGSLSGKTSNNRSPMKSYMAQSRSYNSLNVLNFSNVDERLRSGSLAALNKDYNLHDIDALCNLIQHNLNLNHHDRIRGIFSALIMDNDHDRIEEIIDRFEGDDRALLMEIVGEAGYGLKESESIFDMTMSRTDLHNHLRPGISMSSISDVYYQQTVDNDKMVYWRADIEELLPPPMKPPPKPMPTNLLKSAIISPESLIHVDNKVLEVMDMEPTTFTELILFLTRDCSKDVEKVRALFRWITMYDIRSTNFDPAAPNDTLVGVLRSIKCGQMSNNELFFRMCRFAGIHCQFISGYSKGAGYRPGMAIKDNRMFRNVWTAVYVAGAWRFVNCNWGARYLTSKHQELPPSGTLLSRTSQSQNTELKYRCDEFYFLTDAKQHIFEHFPDKKRWQLLNRPITLDQFMALPIVKSPFFNANLSFKRNYAEVLQTKKGKVTVKLNMPQAVGVSVRLENRADGSILRGLTLVRILDNQMIVVTAAPSQPGKFYLSIYVNDNWKSEDNMEMACSFQIHCSEHNYDRLVTGRFPDVGVLGSTPASQNLGIIANPGVDPFVLWDERSTLKLNLAFRPGLRVGQRMMSYDRSGQNSAPCDSYALLQYQTQGRSQYHLRFPIEGFYCLTIYAGIDDPNVADTEPMECIYRLLIDCKRAQERIQPFPRQTSRWVGFRLIEPLCQQLDLNTVYRFRILATQCSAMSVVINDVKWIDLVVTGDGLWKGKVNTGQELENLSVYGKFGTDDDEEFIKLLDYILVAKTGK